MKAVVVSSLILCSLIVAGTASAADVSPPQKFTPQEQSVENQAQSPMDIQDPIYTASEDDSNLGANKPEINEDSDFENEPQIFVSC